MITQVASANPIVRLLRRSAVRRAARRFLTRLPPRLLKDYGHAGPYTPGQVVSTIERERLSPAHHVGYALAIFCEAADLDRYRRETDASDDYAALRRQLADAFFDGDSAFTLGHVERYWRRSSLFGDAYAGFGGSASGDVSSGHGGHGGGHH